MEGTIKHAARVIQQAHQTCWQCPDCGERMLARDQWDHQCGEGT